ncbi:hypothetical protein Y032_0951g3183 [Ancylostoma ceylanicum]|nr:hypothetical protein Y032_0951g3183 [Ancylostoma ceylanicum]
MSRNLSTHDASERTSPQDSSENSMSFTNPVMHLPHSVRFSIEYHFLFYFQPKGHPPLISYHHGTVKATPSNSQVRSSLNLGMVISTVNTVVSRTRGC